jgi:DNA-binding GntR family transcriptional regulator
MTLGKLPIVDKGSPLPIYKQLANWMTSRITKGDWPPNSQLPAEVDLAKELGVSRGSLRKAIHLLIQRNLLCQIHGKGTFVSAAVIEQRWAGQLVGTSEELLSMGIPFVTQVLEQRLLPSPKREGQILELKSQDQVVYLKRLRWVGDVPIVLHENFLPATRYAHLLEVDFSQERLLATLEERYGLRLTWADHIIAAIRADASVASSLQLDVDDPVLYNEHIVYDQEGHKVEFGKSWFRADRIRLRTAVRRGSTDDVYAIGIPVKQGAYSDAKEGTPHTR